MISWCAIILGFIGILSIIKPSFSGFNIGMLFGLGSGIVMAIAALIIRRMNRTEKPYQSLFYYFLGASVILLPFFIFDSRNLQHLLNWQIILLLIGIGISMFILQFTLIKAFAYGKPSILDPISYTAILFSGLYDWFLWGIIPDF